MKRRLFWMVLLCLTAAPVGVRAGEPEGAAPTGLAGRLLYSRLTGGTWQIWQADLATGERTQVTFSAGDKRYPAWTSEGGIAYHTSNQACYPARRDSQEEDPLLRDLWPIRDVAWSPEGNRIAVARFRTDLVDSANLWVVDAAGRQQIITREAGIQYEPAWSPDGARIAYVAGHGYGTYELYAVNADGTDSRRLTQNSSHEFSPAWSPDGASIAYASDASGNYEIWIMKADGSQPRQLTRSPGLDIHPVWSPDGSRIAFTTNRSGALEIWVMNPDGTRQQPLERAGEGGACDPAWR